eukprot:1809104-Rhodomonas_salina.1
MYPGSGYPGSFASGYPARGLGVLSHVRRRRSCDCRTTPGTTRVLGIPTVRNSEFPVPGYLGILPTVGGGSLVGLPGYLPGNTRASVPGYPGTRVLAPGTRAPTPGRNSLEFLGQQSQERQTCERTQYAPWWPEPPKCA